MTEALCTACWAGSADDVKKMCAGLKEPSEINLTNSRARQGHAGVVLELFKNSSLDIDCKTDVHLSTPLHAASFGAHPAVVALLLLKGANSSLVNSAGLSARQEARGDARFVYQLFEEGKISELAEKYPVCKSLAKKAASARRTPKASGSSDESKKAKTTEEPPIRSASKSAKSKMVRAVTKAKLPKNSPESQASRTDLLVATPESVLTFQDRDLGIEMGLCKVFFPLDTVFKVKVISDTVIQIFWRDFREVRVTFPEVTAKKIGYTSLMTALEKKICTRPTGFRGEFPPKAVTEVSRMFIKEEWIKGEAAQWKKSTFEIMLPKDISERALSHLSMFYFAGHVPFPCWDLNGVMLLRAQRPEESAFFSLSSMASKEAAHTFYEQLYLMANEQVFRGGSGGAAKKISVFDIGISKPQQREFMPYTFYQSYQVATNSIFNIYEKACEGFSVAFDEPLTAMKKFKNSQWFELCTSLFSVVKSMCASLRQGTWIVIQGTKDCTYVDSVIACLLQIIIDVRWRQPLGLCCLLQKDWFLEAYPFTVTSNTDYWPYLLLLFTCISCLCRQQPQFFAYNEEFLNLVLDKLARHASKFVGINSDAKKPIFWQEDGPEITRETLRCIMEIYSTNDRQYSYEWRDTPTVGCIPLDHPVSLLNGCFSYALRNASHSTESFFQEWIDELKSKKAKGNCGRFYFWLPYGKMNEIKDTTKLTVVGRCLSRVPTDFSELVNLTELNLEGNMLDTIPVELASLHVLKKLNISRNQIAHIPASFGSNLTALEEIDLSHNKLIEFGGVTEFRSLKSLRLGFNTIEELPIILANLTGLTDLFLESNGIMNVPTTLTSCLTDLIELNLDHNKIRFFCDNWNLPSLVSLSLNKNKLNDLPTTVQNSTNLQFVKIGGNDFTAIPSAISKLENLVRLDAHTNKIAEIPEWLSDSKKLEKLGLKENNLTAISPAFGRMKNLNYLDLSNNKIDRLPIAFGWIPPRLTKINLAGNTLPKEILDAPDVLTIKKIVESEMGSMVPLNENVLMIIGEKGSGKTNLYNSIVAGWTEKICGVKTQVRPKKKKSNIRSEQKKEPSFEAKILNYMMVRSNPNLLVRRYKFLDKDDSVVCVNAWDVSTKAVKAGCVNHFWTEETVLAITIAAHDQNATVNLGNYLNVIKASVSDPPIIIVVTFADELLKKHPSKKLDSFTNSLVNVVKECGGLSNVVIASTDNMEGVKTTILSMLQKSEIPNNWNVLRSFLRKEVVETKGGLAPIISKNKLFLIAHGCGIPERTEALQAVRKLHRCGSICYFRHDSLADKVFLEPNWLVSVIASPLDFPQRDSWIKLSELESFLVAFPSKHRSTCIDVLEQFNSIFIFGDRKRHLIDEPRNVLVFALVPEKEPPVPKWANLLTRRQLLTHRSDDGDENESEEEQENSVSTLIRVIEFVWLPQGLWLHIITHIVTLLRDSCSVNHVLMWENGLKALVKGQVPAVVTVTRTSLTKTLLTGNRTHALKVEVSARDLMTSRSVFAGLAASLSNELQTWKSLTWRAYAIVSDVGIPRLPLDSAIDDQIKEGKVKMTINGNTFNFYDVVPERVFIEYEGPRILSSKKTLGEGGFALVYQGTLHGATIAVKVLQEQRTGTQALMAVEDFRKEVMIQSRLKHPNILAMLGICMMPMCIVMELCPHGELQQYVKSAKPLTWPLRLKFASDIALGVQYMQDQNPPVAHLDLKSRNVLLSSLDIDQVCAKICDFGTSQVVSAPLTECDCDNPVYQAPEILEGKPFNQSVDIYAYGIILWELLTREDYCANFNYVIDIINHISSGHRENIPAFSPPLYTMLITMCWHQNPKKRPDMNWVLSNLRALRNQARKLEATIGIAQAKELLKQKSPNSPRVEATPEGTASMTGSGRTDGESTIVKQVSSIFPLTHKQWALDTENAHLPSSMKLVEKRKAAFTPAPLNHKSIKCVCAQRTVLILVRSAPADANQRQRSSSAPFPPKVYWQPTKPEFMLRLIQVTEHCAVAVKPHYSSICKSDVFLLDCGHMLLQWNGKHSSPATKAVAKKLSKLFMSSCGNSSKKHIIYGKITSPSQCSISNEKCSTRGEIKAISEIDDHKLTVTTFDEVNHYLVTDSISLCTAHHKLFLASKKVPKPKVGTMRGLRMTSDDSADEIGAEGSEHTSSSHEGPSSHEIIKASPPSSAPMSPTTSAAITPPQLNTIWQSSIRGHLTKVASRSHPNASGDEEDSGTPADPALVPIRTGPSGLPHLPPSPPDIERAARSGGVTINRNGRRDSSLGSSDSSDVSEKRRVGLRQQIPIMPASSAPVTKLPAWLVHPTPSSTGQSPSPMASGASSRIPISTQSSLSSSPLDSPSSSPPQWPPFLKDSQPERSQSTQTMSHRPGPNRATQLLRSLPKGAERPQAKTLSYAKRTPTEEPMSITRASRSKDDSSVEGRTEKTQTTQQLQTLQQRRQNSLSSGWGSKPKTQQCQEDLEKLFWSLIDGPPPPHSIASDSLAPKFYNPKVYKLVAEGPSFAYFNYLSHFTPSSFSASSIYFIDVGFELIVHVGAEVKPQLLTLFLWDHIEIFKTEFELPYLKTRVTTGKDLLLSFAFQISVELEDKS